MLLKAHHITVNMFISFKSINVVTSSSHTREEVLLLPAKMYDSWPTSLYFFNRLRHKHKFGF